MTGETDLGRMLATLQVRRREGVYVYATLPPGAALPDLPVSAVITEEEGTTLVLRQADAEQAGLAATFPAAWLTLSVRSSLAAVGLTAVVSGALAAEGIPCNVLAAANHDHILVPEADADRAVAAVLLVAEQHR